MGSNFINKDPFIFVFGGTQDFYSVRHFNFFLVIPGLTRLLMYEQKLDIRDLVFPRTGRLSRGAGVRVKGAISATD